MEVEVKFLLGDCSKTVMRSKLFILVQQAEVTFFRDVFTVRDASLYKISGESFH